MARRGRVEGALACVRGMRLLALRRNVNRTTPMPRARSTPADSPPSLPLYVQVAATLRTAIARGIHAPGSRLPTEAALCRRFQVSRHTIRDALRQLRHEGLITSTPGSRPVVAETVPAQAAEQLDTSIGADFFDYMLGTRLMVEASEMLDLPPELAAEAGLAAHEPWLSVRGWRTDADDGHATCWNEYLIRPDYEAVAQMLPRHLGPLLPLLEELSGQRITTLSRATSAIPMPAAQAARFGVAPGSPALAVLTRCAIASGETVLVHRSVHAQGAVTYSIKR